MSLKGIHELNSKIYKDLTSLEEKVSFWQSEGNKVVFTNGCFDILHKGHVSYLAESAALGNKLIVALNTDRSVKRQQKSVNRPLQDQESRSLVMSALGFVDAVILFDEDTPLNLIMRLRPDILVKGADYTVNQIVGSTEVIGWGGLVKTIPLIDGYSTTAIEKKILNQ